jgi:hypothetical protein
MSETADPSPTPSPPELRENQVLAQLLGETARLLEAQKANPYRVKAYRDAADTVGALESPVRALWSEGGRAALERLPRIGESLSKTIETWLETGALGILLRLRGEEAAEPLLMTLPGIGPELARRIHERLGISSLEELETAAHDGRLADLPGIGPRRLRSIQDLLAARLRRGGRRYGVEAGTGELPPDAGEILDVDKEYRQRAARGDLPTIAPRRQNPERRSWLPILHTQRGSRLYTAVFSNTPLAHQLGRTGDWVVIYLDDGRRERQWTVVTEFRGSLAGKRVIRGREPECLAHYRSHGCQAG